MMATENKDRRVGPQHTQRPAVVYLRQAVVPHRRDEDTLAARREALVARASSLGWSRDHIVVIDEDDGRSAHRHRPGFAHLLCEVRLGRVGMIVCTEPSRLARSTADWQTLVQACADAGTVLCFRDRIVEGASLAGELRLLTSAITH